jgi:hypothetical protein
MLDVIALWHDGASASVPIVHTSSVKDVDKLSSARIMVRLFDDYCHLCMTMPKSKERNINEI